MKKLIILTILVLLSNAALAVEPARIAVVNMQKLLESSTAAKDIRERAKKERDKYQALISKEEESLRKEEAKLQAQHTTLTQEMFAKKSREFKDKVAKVQRDFQEKRASHEETLKKSLDKVNREVFEIIDALAQEDGFDITIPTSQILYATEKLDITDKVLDRLNKKLPEVTKDKNTKKDNTKKK